MGGGGGGTAPGHFMLRKLELVETDEPPGSFKNNFAFNFSIILVSDNRKDKEFVKRSAYFSFSIFKNGLTMSTLTTQKTATGTTVP